MISSEVQRTLVKSPPELWAELSDPAALARHLGELGEVRITRAEPEKRVEWEAETARGTVLIKPSGWGTKVTLSVTREIEASVQEASDIEENIEPPPDSQLVPEPAVEVVEQPEANAEILEPDPDMAPAEESLEPVGAELESEQTSVSEPAGVIEVPEPAIELTSPSEPAPQPMPRRGFFARLFGRRQPKVPEPVEAPSQQSEAETLTDSAPIPIRPEQPVTGEAKIAGAARSSSAIESLQARFQAEPTSEPVVDADPEPEPEPEPVAAQGEQPAELVTEADEQPEEPQEDASRPSRDLAAELKAAEEAAAEEVTAVLTAVLDRLGAAHHRPFSRA